MKKDDADQHNHQLIRQLRGIMDQHRAHGQLVLGGVPMVADDMITFIRNDLLVFGCGVFLFLVLILNLEYQKKHGSQFLLLFPVEILEEVHTITSLN